MASLIFREIGDSWFTKKKDFARLNDLAILDSALSKSPQRHISASGAMFRHVCAIVMASIASLTFIASQPALAADSDTARLWFPLTKSELRHTPKFVLELTDVPDHAKSKKWGENAKEVCEEWFPVLCKFLATDGWTPPDVVKLVMKTDMEVPGSTSGSTISINDHFITKHPDDFGMVIHELVHVIQRYPDSHAKAGWLIEGICDYLRYWKYESEKPKHKLGENATYHDGYATTASFLAWIVWKYDRRAVRRLDAALRKGEYDDALFHKITGKNLPELWEEYVKYEQKHS